MALNPLFQIEQLPATSQAAIREFDERYLAKLGASKPTGWADTLGDLVPTAAPMVTFPVSQLRTRYQKTEGEQRFKKLREKSFDVKTEEFDDGYEAKLLDILQKVFAYRNWQQAPGRLVLAEEQHRHSNIAALLENGAALPCVDGVNFFATNHPANMIDASAGVWGNYQANPTDCVSIANLQAEVTAMMAGVLDENGLRMGAQPDTILVPPEKAEALKNLLAQALILGGGLSTSITSAAISNPYLNRFNVIPVKEFTDVNDWYLVDSKLVAEGIAPWLSLRQTVASSLSLRIFDESSDFFKNTGMIKMSSHIWYGFALALPHAIRKIVGA